MGPNFYGDYMIRHITCDGDNYEYSPKTGEMLVGCTKPKDIKCDGWCIRNGVVCPYLSIRFAFVAGLPDCADFDPLWDLD